MMKNTILVVEDEPIVALELRETLEKLGYAVPPVVDSADGVLESALRFHPNLVLMDIRLKSYLDGIDAAHRLKMLHDIPVIFLTAHSSDELKNRASRLKPASFLIKPVEENVLHSHIQLALAGQAGGC
jgi:CheY-like chemotaxis protein